jgi:hypothetical protein
LQNRLLNAADVFKNFIIPEPGNPPTAPLEPRRASLVVSILGVLSAIGLDDQAMLEANEIDDERPETVLTAKFAAQSSVPESGPKLSLGICHIDAELFDVPIGQPSPSRRYAPGPPLSPNGERGGG